MKHVLTLDPFEDLEGDLNGLGFWKALILLVVCGLLLSRLFLDPPFTRIFVCQPWDLRQFLDESDAVVAKENTFVEQSFKDRFGNLPMMAGGNAEASNQ